MKCKKHPSYKGRKESTSKCTACAAIFEHQHPLDLARKQKHEAESKRQLEKTLRDALGQIDDFEKHVEAIKQLKDSHDSYPIEAQEKSGTSEATALVTATDWHFGSRVKPEQVNDMNEFDVAIAKRRISTFFERVARLIRKEQQDVKITDLVLFLGGDLINGSLIGVTPFGIAMRGEYQPPIQAFTLIDKKRGPTVQIPILV